MSSHINPNLTNALPGFDHQNRPPLLIKVIHDWKLYSVYRVVHHGVCRHCQPDTGTQHQAAGTTDPTRLIYTVIEFLQF